MIHLCTFSALHAYRVPRSGILWALNSQKPARGARRGDPEGNSGVGAGPMQSANICKHCQYYYLYRSANPKPKAIGHACKTPAATSAGPIKICSLVFYHISSDLKHQTLKHSLHSICTPKYPIPLAYLEGILQGNPKLGRHITALHVRKVCQRFYRCICRHH